MRANLLRAVLLGPVAEFVAIALAYGIYRVVERIPLYALFYVPIYDRIFLPVILRLGWTHHAVDYCGLLALAGINSLKRAGDILLFKNRRWILGGVLTAVLLATVIVSVSLKGTGI